MVAEQTDQKARNQEGRVQELSEFVNENHLKAIIGFYEKKEKVQELRHLGESKAETGA